MRALLVLVTLVALGAADAMAQDDTLRGPRVSISLLGGGFSPRSEFDDGARFRTGGTIGGAVAFWPIRHLGIRGLVLRTETDVHTSVASPLTDQDPEVWYFGGDLVGRLPIASLARWGWHPYLFGGLGAKRYEFDLASDLDDDTDFVASLGGGLEYRLGRVGIQGEARGLFSTFDRLGYDQGQRDLAYTAGISFHF
jgi:hypothetical protein